MELFLGLVFSISCLKKIPQKTPKKPQPNKSSISVFSSTIFPSSLAQTVCPMILFWTDLWELKSVGSAQAPSPSCNYIFLKCILCKGEDQLQAGLGDRAVEIDAVSALEAGLFLKGMSENALILNYMEYFLK